jgi:excisionase family DNA binding protein
MVEIRRNEVGDLQEPLVTTQELAERLGCSERSIRRWRKAGIISAIETPGLVRFQLSVVLRELKVERAQNPTNSGISDPLVRSPLS